jgi:pimeloyl-ACP methyl ester carboxylesterase
MPPVELFCEESGAGEPVIVFLHPGMADSGLWEPQWQTYAPPYRLLRFDLPGFGRTPMRAGTFVFAAQIAQALDERGVTDAAIVGCSLGGRIALELAAARPELVRSLVLVGASMPGLAASDDARAAGAAEREALDRGDLDAAVEANIRMWVDGPLRGPEGVDPEVRRKVAEMCRHSFELWLPFKDTASAEPLVPDLEQRLGSIGQPALVVVGTGDAEYIVRSPELLAAALPDARVTTIQGAGHVPSLEQPAAFDAHVLPFLAETT